MRIVIVVAGTRGDVQPSVALAVRLHRLGHVVRLATHEAHRPLVLQAGASFYPLGGDPVALTKVAVDARGMLPCSLASFMTVRKEYEALINSTVEACMLDSIDTEESAAQAPLPDLIISTPITHGVSHVAEALGVPLHIVSAVPWCPSKVLPHPWARAWDLSWNELTQMGLDKVLPSLSATRADPKPTMERRDATAAPTPQTSPASASLAGPVSPLCSAFASAQDNVSATSHLPVGCSASAVPSCDNADDADEPFSAQTTGKGTKLSKWYSGIRGKVHQSVQNQVSWFSTVLLDQMVIFGVADIIIALRLRLGLPPWGPGWSLYKHPHTFTFSRHLLPVPIDWSSRMIVSGPLLLEREDQPPELMAAQLASAHSLIDDLMPELSVSSAFDRTLDSILDSDFDVAAHQPLAQARTATDGVEPSDAKDQGHVREPRHAETGIKRKDRRHSLSSRDCPAPAPAGADDWSGTMDHCATASSALPTALDRFLDAGVPPVYVGFGSCSAQLCKGTSLAVSVVLAAVNTGTRLVINRAMWEDVTEDWDQLAEQLQHAAIDAGMPPVLVTAADLNSSIHLVDEMPHDRLLPRCSGVVHHGGAGTLQAGLLAGCPTLVCPVYGDQFFWGEVAHSVGIGPMPLPAYKLDAPTLAQAFQELCQPKHLDQATHMSQLLRAEASQSLDMAVDHILKHLDDGHGSHSTLLAPGPDTAMQGTSGAHARSSMDTSTLDRKAAVHHARASVDKRESGSGGGWAQTLLRVARLRLCRFWY